MDIGGAFTFMFEDSDWIKVVLLGAVVLLLTLLIPVVGWIGGAILLMGYMLTLLKNTRDGHPLPLPSWNDFSGYFGVGLMVFVAMVIYNLPGLLISCVQTGISAAGSSAEDAQQAITIASSCLGCLSMIYSLLLGVVTPAILISYARDFTFKSAFDFKTIMAIIKADFGKYILAVVVGWAASLIGGIGIIACGIGIFATLFWSLLVQGYIYGELAKVVEPKMA